MAAWKLTFAVIAVLVLPLVAAGEEIPADDADNVSERAAEQPRGLSSETSKTEEAEARDAPVPYGLDGYCPVSLVEEQVWRRGNPKWRAKHDGKVFLFVGSEQRDRFRAAPERYAPVAGGNDIVLAKDAGKNLPGSRRHGVFYNDKILLFTSAATLAKFEKKPDSYIELPDPAAVRDYGLAGFCPVTLVEKQVWRLGDVRWRARHDGQTYLFAGPEQLRQFRDKPEHYAPVAGGNDIVLAKDAGKTVAGNRRHGVFYHGKVLLFANAETLAKFEQNPGVYFDSPPSDAAATEKATTENITLEQLLAKVPVLSPENPELKSFQFTAEVPAPLGFLVPMEAGWAAPDEFGTLFTSPRGRVPVALLAQDQLLLYNAATATVTLCDNVRPNLVLRATDEKLTLSYGWTTREVPQFAADLPSFFRGCQSEPELRKIDATTWRFTGISKSGKSRLVAWFEPAAVAPAPHGDSLAGG